MRFSATPDAGTAIRAVENAVRDALAVIEELQSNPTFVYEDDFGVAHVAPAAFADQGAKPQALGLITAAEGISLAFSDEDASVFRIRDLEWAARNLRAIAGELDTVDDFTVELPHDERVAHIQRAVLREVTRHSPVALEQMTRSAAVKLRGSESLDDQQRAAVQSPSGQDLLVNAGAGSGKTHMLSMRIARLVAEGAVSADRCVVLTFSRGAREQIQQRLNAFALAEHPVMSGIDVRTIHSLGRRVLHLAASTGRTRVRPGFQVMTDGRRVMPNGTSVTAPSLFLEQYDRIFTGVADGKTERARLALYPSAINALRSGHPQLGVVATASDLPEDGT